MGLQLRRRHRRGPGRHAEPAGRQGRQPRRDVAASACRCRRASPSPPKSAPTSTPTTRPIPTDLSDEVANGAGAGRENASARKFGDADNPLLVSVRSGARASMPGMMDTVLNLGLNDADGRGPRQEDRRRALRLRQLSPLHPDVRRRRARRRSPPFRGRARSGRSSTTGVEARHRADGRRLAGGHRRVQGARPSASSASPSRRTRRSSSGARSAPCSARG